MRIRFLGSDSMQSYSRSGSPAFGMPITVGEERGCEDDEGAYLLQTFPGLFERSDLPATRPETVKVEALAGPESDKQTKAPKRKAG